VAGKGYVKRLVEPCQRLTLSTKPEEMRDAKWPNAVN
jgi:hypothetical protein